MVSNVLKVIYDSPFEFYKTFLQFLGPLIKLTPREIDVAASLLMHRKLLSASITDINILDSVTLSTKTYEQIEADCNIALPHFNVILGKLRKAGFIVDGRINPRYIPNMQEDNSYSLLLSFKSKHNEVPGNTETCI